MCHAFSIYQQRGEESPGPGFIALVGFCDSTTTIRQQRKTLHGLLVCLCQLVSSRASIGKLHFRSRLSYDHLFSIT